MKKNSKFDGIGVIVSEEGNPDDPSKKPSVMDLVEATLSPHLRRRAEEPKGSFIYDVWSGSDKGGNL